MAFDRVWHAGVIHKLYQLELPDRLVIIIHQYISNRHFTFRLDNTYSSVRPIRADVPQGSTLSPLLYSAYVNDIPRPKSGVQLALFADDTALFLRSNCLRNILPRLQRAIDELTHWLRLWRIEVNPEKRFLVRESRTHLCAQAHGRPIMGFSPPSPPFSHGENYKKKMVE
ncbi:Probable RNA-directed DNA polymerase from transposon BS [Eumeta japonica]|uniref:Probable RNA-directed DNA polymerase from transposon BS n=1 Tax=Eumeta variegata TaxID=151549 RepID=A0A4C1ZKW1_EUMVA|nr:Probable RNA-directed DNA polymerase from transposon BS [Eumeta japonica]